jgi:Ca2+-binding RTX toxin-like protein
MIAAALAVLALCAALPAAADASLARISSGRPVYDAFGGEVNHPTTKRIDATHVDIEDVVPITAGEGCTSLSAMKVRCTNRKTQQGAWLRLGDMNDTYTGPFFSDGGPGDDVLAFTGAWDPELVQIGAVGGSSGGAGNDTITGIGDGGEGDDTLTAVPGQGVSLRGGAGNDQLKGSTGDDFFEGGPGNDHIVSGGGRDRLSFAEDLKQPVVFSLENGPMGGRAGEADTYDGTFVDVWGDNGGSDLTGNDLANSLSADHAPFRGAGASNRLTGLGGDDGLLGGENGGDQLSGGTGDDIVMDGDLNGGSDRLDGGDGDDVIGAYDFGEEDSVTDENEGNPTPDDISCGAGKDRANVDTADVVPADCEIVALRTDTGSTITGTTGDDRLPGFNGDGDEDKILGLAGDDTLLGGTGEDRLFGQDGDDRLEGDGQGELYEQFGGRDVLSGANGDDHLIGGYDNDRLTGGTGRDRFSGGFGNDRIGARDGERDKITCGKGFDRVTADRIDRIASDCESVSRS